MTDKVINEEKESKQATVRVAGKEVPTTIEINRTEYESGRKDVTVVIPKLRTKSKEKLTNG